MSDLQSIIEEVNKLTLLATSVSEGSYRITIQGNNLDQNISEILIKIESCLAKLIITPLTFSSATDVIDADDREDYTAFFNKSWSITLSKASLAALLKSRDEEQKFLFFSTQTFIAWLSELDPFIKISEFDPDFSTPVTFFVNGITEAFGGPSLWVLPPKSEEPDLTSIKEIKLPEKDEVLKLIHINADCLINVSPKGWVVTWGNLTQPAAKTLGNLSAMVLSASIVQELKRSQNNLEVTLRGTKLISPTLIRNVDVSSFLPTLIETVEWVYDQRPETRLKLITDRLSIDISPDQNLLEGMKAHLAEALKQAKDSYSFVILERKDAYHKEMRELMKDMKSQADLYASKVRDLVNSLTRDVLGMLVFLGFSFIGKFDREHLDTVLESNELSLLMKFMAGYLMMSYLLQLITHISDASLSFNESQKWLKVLQNYTSRQDNNDGFINPIQTRRYILFFALFVIGIIYILLSIVVWNLSFFVKLLLAQ